MEGVASSAPPRKDGVTARQEREGRPRRAGGEARHPGFSTASGLRRREASALGPRGARDPFRDAWKITPERTSPSNWTEGRWRGPGTPTQTMSVSEPNSTGTSAAMAWKSFRFFVTTYAPNRYAEHAMRRSFWRIFVRQSGWRSQLLERTVPARAQSAWVGVRSRPTLVRVRTAREIAARPRSPRAPESISCRTTLLNQVCGRILSRRWAARVSSSGSRRSSTYTLVSRTYFTRIALGPAPSGNRRERACARRWP